LLTRYGFRNMMLTVKRGKWKDRLNCEYKQLSRYKFPPAGAHRKRSAREETMIAAKNKRLKYIGKVFFMR